MAPGAMARTRPQLATVGLVETHRLGSTRNHCLSRITRQRQCGELLPIVCRQHRHRSPARQSVSSHHPASLAIESCRGVEQAALTRVSTPRDGSRCLDSATQLSERQVATPTPVSLGAGPASKRRSRITGPRTRTVTRRCRSTLTSSGRGSSFWHRRSVVNPASPGGVWRGHRIPRETDKRAVGSGPAALEWFQEGRVSAVPHADS